MQSKEQDNLIFLRLFPEEDIYEGIREVCREYKVETDVILSGLGQLGSFELGFFKEKGNYLPEKFTEPHELVMLTGNVSLHARNASPARIATQSIAGGHSDAGGQGEEYNFHLHAVLSDANKKVVGGHFLGGKVSVTGEIVLLKTNLTVQRRVEPETGLSGLFLE